MKKLILVFFIVMAGCGASKNQPVPVEKRNYFENDLTFYEPSPNEGSLWQGENNGLFADGQAHKKGDTIIIDIVENTSSKTSASTSLKKDSSLEMGIPNAFGVMSHFAGLYPRMKPSKLLNSDVKNDFDGSGTSDRNTNLKGSVGARVINVLPNGDLVVSGNKNVKINNETQIMRVSGIVRPQDVGSDNRVSSTYLSNAQVEIYGKGVISDKQKPGWLARILDKIWFF
ncbi:MAG: flagellin biosynthesis protein FlgH [Deltaproteobacteria bacterium]|nr:MAG: flagellin biosynthesis protein FlgH [Deltaproteobacteria bacterium]